MLRTSAVPAHTLVVQLLENYTFLSMSRMEALKVGSKGLKVVHYPGIPTSMSYQVKT